MRAQTVAILSINKVLKNYKAVVIIGGNLFSTYCHVVLILLRRSTINQEAADELRQRNSSDISFSPGFNQVAAPCTSDPGNRFNGFSWESLENR